MDGIFGLRQAGLQHIGNALKLGLDMRLILQVADGFRQQGQSAIKAAHACRFVAIEGCQSRLPRVNQGLCM